MNHLVDIAVAGELIIDFILNKLDVFDEAGKEKPAGEMILNPGGSGTIIASKRS